VERRSPTENPTPRELQRQLAAEREGHPFLAYRDAEDELVLQPLPTPDTVTIGRGEGVDVRIGWDPQVSQLHAELRSLGGEWLVVDDGLSRNGTFVDGERVAGRRRLRDRDLLRAGSTLILFRYPGAEATRGETAMAAENAPELTPAQRRVLVALCRPLAEGSGIATPATNREIADELVLSVEAVKAHLRGLFERFDVGDLPQNQKRVALAERAFRTGAVTPRDLRLETR
jgi:FHA domain